VESTKYVDMGELEFSSPAGTVVIERDAEEGIYLAVGGTPFVPSEPHSLSGSGRSSFGRFETAITAPALDLIAPVEWDCEVPPGCEGKYCGDYCDNSKPCELWETAADLSLSWSPSSGEDVIVLYESIEASCTIGACDYTGHRWTCRFSDDGAASLPRDILGRDGDVYIFRLETRSFAVDGLSSSVGVAFQARPTCFPFAYHFTGDL